MLPFQSSLDVTVTILNDNVVEKKIECFHASWLPAMENVIVTIGSNLTICIEDDDCKHTLIFITNYTFS